VALRRALRNLIENSVRYDQRCRVRLEGDRHEARIVVEDDGPGIPEAEQERVFEPFVRLEGSRSAETGGIGLGLAIARSIVRAHGGDIRMANRPEGGLAVTVALPAVTSPG
jgi:signal transduction histidine kinase